MRRETLLLLLCGGLLGLVDAGCGHCDGAIRNMRAQRAEWLRGRGRGGGECKKNRERGPQEEAPTAIAADESFRIVGDGPNRAGPELMQLSGVDARSWVLLADATGQPVPADVTADAGGHMCLRGVGFNLRPRAPLAAGAYTLVLYLDRARWPLLHSDRRASHAGRPAFVRRFRVTE